MKGSYIEINELKMYYIEKGEGYPLILLHGGGSTAEWNWEKQIPVFSEQYKVFALDSRGHGRSNNPAGKLSYKLMCEDVIAFIDSFNLEKPIICGWSDGAQIALEIGIRYPSVVKALIVGGALIEISEKYIAGMKSIGIEGIEKVNFDKFEKTVPDYAKSLKEKTVAMDWKDLVLGLSALWLNPEEFPKERIRDITVPTIIIAGDRDTFIPLDETVKIFKLLSHAELAIIPNANHDVFETKSGLFNDIVMEFLVRHK